MKRSGAWSIGLRRRRRRRRFFMINSTHAKIQIHIQRNNKIKGFFTWIEANAMRQNET